MSSKIVKVRLDVPGEVSDQARRNAQRRSHEAAVLSLWEEGEITSSRAAQELDLGIHDFLDLLATRGLPVESGSLNLEAIDAARQKLDRMKQRGYGIDDTRYEEALRAAGEWPTT